MLYPRKTPLAYAASPNSIVATLPALAKSTEVRDPRPGHRPASRRPCVSGHLWPGTVAHPGHVSS